MHDIMSAWQIVYITYKYLHIHYIYVVCEGGAIHKVENSPRFNKSVLYVAIQASSPYMRSLSVYNKCTVLFVCCSGVVFSGVT